MKIPNCPHCLLTILLSVTSLVIFTIRMGAQPVITAQPVNQSVLLGGSANFSVAASGAPSISYLWQFQGTNTTNTGSSLAISIAHHADYGLYDVIVSNQTGSVTSDVVSLTITGARPIVTLVTNKPGYNVISLQYTVAPNIDFQLFEVHDLTQPVQWFGPVKTAYSGGATNYNWCDTNATNYTEYYPHTFWLLDPYP
jgi:hypothetical protein